MSEEVRLPGKSQKYVSAQHSSYRSKHLSGNKHFKRCLADRPNVAQTQCFYKMPFWFFYFSVLLFHLMESDHREVGFFWFLLMVKQIDTVSIYLLVTVTIYWFFYSTICWTATQCRKMDRSCSHPDTAPDGEIPRAGWHVSNPQKIQNPENVFFVSHTLLGTEDISPLASRPCVWSTWQTQAG